MREMSWRSALVLPLVAAAYLAALVYRYDTKPGPPCNEVVEEALSGYLMLAEHDLRPIYTALNPNGHEVLHVVAIGALAHLFPGDQLAILIPAWLSAIALLILLALFARRSGGLVDEWLLLAFAVSCLWLFHYSRTGLRATSSPALLLAFALVLEHAWRRRPGGVDLAAGMLLAAGTYAYSSLRLAVVAFAVFAVLELGAAFRRSRGEGVATAHKVALVAGGFLLAFSWAAVWAVREPGTFFGRGLYVFRGGVADRLANALWTVLLPVRYDDQYLALAGPRHIFDSVALGLPNAGLSAIPPLLGVVSLVGLVVALRSWRESAAMRYLLIAYGGFVVLLGSAGPSLTRLFAVFPILVICGALALTRLVRGRPTARIAVLVSLLLLATWECVAYLRSDVVSDPTRPGASAMSTAVGRRAREVSERGARPLCVVGRERNVVRFLTIGHWDRVRIEEFHERAVSLGELRPALEGAEVVLVDDTPNLAPLLRHLRRDPSLVESRGAGFHEFGRRPRAPGR